MASMMDIQKVLDQYPTLGYLGFCTPKQNRECEILLRSLPEINHVVEWLSHAKKIKNINKRIGSYGLKRMAEAAMDKGYISTGQFITGAILAGFKCEWVGGFNACFNISMRSVRQYENRRIGGKPKFLE